MSKTKTASPSDTLKALILGVACGKKEKVVRQWFYERYCQDPSNVQFPTGRVYDLKNLFDADTNGFEIAYNSFNYTINTKIKDALISKEYIKDDDAVSINLTTGVASVVTAPVKIDIDQNIVDIKDMAFGTYPLRRTGKALDLIMSDIDEGGGIYPGVYITIGESGVGKTTILLDAIKSAQKELYKKKLRAWWKKIEVYLIEQKTKKKVLKPEKPTLKQVKEELNCLYISSEMTKDDLFFAYKRQKEIGTVKTLLLMDYFNGGMDIALQQAFSKGYDIIVFDSYQDTIVKMIDVLGWKPRAAGTFLIKMMLDSAEAGSAVFAIQHMTKGGQYVGGTFLKHCTTGMIEVRYASDGTRYISVIKNRRGGSLTNIPLYYKMDKVTGDVIYDDRRLKSDMKKKEDREYQDSVMSDLDAKFDDEFFDTLSPASEIELEVENEQDE